MPILGRSRKALFPYRESYKSDETRFSANPILLLQDTVTGVPPDSFTQSGQ